MSQLNQAIISEFCSIFFSTKNILSREEILDKLPILISLYPEQELYFSHVKSILKDAK